ncbi:hypothetical protein ACU4GD_41195 [Cupriavidus basilensis]
MDSGPIGDAPASLALAAGTPIKIIGANRSDPFGTAVLVRADSPLKKTAADPRGKSIGNQPWLHRPFRRPGQRRNRLRRPSRRTPACAARAPPADCQACPGQRLGRVRGPPGSPTPRPADDQRPRTCWSADAEAWSGLSYLAV